MSSTTDRTAREEAVDLQRSHHPTKDVPQSRSRPIKRCTYASNSTNTPTQITAQRREEEVEGENTEERKIKGFTEMEEEQRRRKGLRMRTVEARERIW